MTKQTFDDPPGAEIAILGGGCFWCIEAALARLAGVHSAISGYCGGARPQPSYEAVCSGATGHAEVVRVAFDPAVLPLATLLDVFFAMHDPSTPNRQGHDIGTQYRSVIFAQDEMQRRAAQEAVARVDASGAWGAPAVTEIAPEAPFWPAEDYHQRYYEGHGRQPYCQAVIAPKLAKLGHHFAALLKPAA